MYRQCGSGNMKGTPWPLEKDPCAIVKQRFPSDGRRGETQSSRRLSREDSETIRMSQSVDIRHLHRVEGFRKRNLCGGRIRLSIAPAAMCLLRDVQGHSDNPGHPCPLPIAVPSRGLPLVLQLGLVHATGHSATCTGVFFDPPCKTPYSLHARLMTLRSSSIQSYCSA